MNLYFSLIHPLYFIPIQKDIINTIMNIFNMDKFSNDWYDTAKDGEKYEPYQGYKSPWTKVDSSFISEIAYYEIANVLEVKLKNGKKYTFMDVPKNIYESFLASPSKGNFFNKVIRKNFVKS